MARYSAHSVIARYSDGQAAPMVPDSWDIAGIKRAAKQVGKLPGCEGGKVTWPRADKVIAAGAAMKGIFYTDAAGQRVKLQVWGPSHIARTYWMAVLDPTFPGEMRLVTYDKAGQVESIDQTVYNCTGHKAHTEDGTSCYGVMSGCCKRVKALAEAA